MARTVLSTRAAALAVVASLLSAPAAGGQSPLSGLRAESARERSLIEETSSLSQTFRTLVHRLEQVPVVVYLRFGHCRGTVAACLEYLGTAAGTTYLRATIDHVNRSPAVLAGLVAHEMFHALEVADARVSTRGEFQRLYSLHGRKGPDGYETDGARAVARRVEDDIVERRLNR
jgi:hypothetical protein